MTEGIEGGVWVVPVEALRDAEARIATLEGEVEHWKGLWQTASVSVLDLQAALRETEANRHSLLQRIEDTEDERDEAKAALRELEEMAALDHRSTVSSFQTRIAELEAMLEAGLASEGNLARRVNELEAALREVEEMTERAEVARALRVRKFDDTTGPTLGDGT